MDRKKVAIVAGVTLAVVLVLVVGWRFIPSGGDNVVPRNSIETAVHESISGYADKLAVDFDLASKAVADGTIKTDAQLYEFILKNSIESRVEAFRAADTVLQEQLPRDADKLKPESVQFLQAFSKAFTREGSHSHE